MLLASPIARRLTKLLALPALGLSVVACDAAEPAPEPYDGPPIPWAYEPFPELVEPLDNPSSPEKVELGRLLFYDPILSRDQATACATCHSDFAVPEVPIAAFQPASR